MTLSKAFLGLGVALLLSFSFVVFSRCLRPGPLSADRLQRLQYLLAPDLR